MKLLELFCGTKSIAKVFEKNGYDVFTVDINKDFEPDLCVDILDLTYDMIPEEFRKPDVIWASPPCTTFSVASLYHYWNDGRPSSKKTWLGISNVLKTLQVIEDLKPKYWFIENPRGMLRKQSFMTGLHRKTVTYCQYGDFRQKPTDIWTNAEHWVPKPACSPGDSCHMSARRGEDRGTQYLHGSKSRAVIPELLCEEIYHVCSNGKYQKQVKLNPTSFS